MPLSAGRKARSLGVAALVVILVCGWSCKPAPKTAYTVPVEYHRLPNGLRVVLSPDATAPIAVVAVYYKIGFRVEPRDRTGFAHLFEHMMFQGSANLGKMEFIRLVESNGGVLNGSTRYDFTNYFEIVPAHKLETVLWAEADRMRGLDITQENLTNQQGVVTNEVKVNVLNQPYGGFPWLDLPQAANVNWHNAHNFYGDLQDLEAATLDDVKAFFKTFYAPNNAVLVIVGDFEPGAALALAEKYFADIPAAELPAPPDLSEPRQEEEKRKVREDPLATKPALAFAYHMPERWTPEYFAMGLLDQILVQGQDSRLHQKLVQEKGVTGAVSGGINFPLGDMFDYNGPMLWSASLIHDETVTPESILALVDEEVEKLRTAPVGEDILARTLIKVRSGYYDSVGGFFGFGRANLLASLALFDDEPGRINRIEDEFRKVTPELIMKTAQDVLRPTNRTAVILKATAKPVGE
ncbi:MAG: insulinase family protein [Candidatus Aminicenantes bacterium]|nr:insulinase family protein [Candidatus Aminicenantes bacterium]